MKGEAAKKLAVDNLIKLFFLHQHHFILFSSRCASKIGMKTSPVDNEEDLFTL
jgi:hypothetical protein